MLLTLSLVIYIPCLASQVNSLVEALVSLRQTYEHVASPLSLSTSCVDTWERRTSNIANHYYGSQGDSWTLGTQTDFNIHLWLKNIPTIYITIIPVAMLAQVGALPRPSLGIHTHGCSRLAAVSQRHVCTLLLGTTWVQRRC